VCNTFLTVIFVLLNLVSESLVVSSPATVSGALSSRMQFMCQAVSDGEQRT